MRLALVQVVPLLVLVLVPPVVVVPLPPPLRMVPALAEIAPLAVLMLVEEPIVLLVVMTQSWRRVALVCLTKAVCEVGSYVSSYLYCTLYL